MQAAPVEIIRRIFELSMPSRDESIANGRISFLDSPWSLTLVSPLWRAIALSTPSLWSSIVIAIEPSTPSWVNYPIALLNLQISRSRPHPVQVVFISKELPGYTTAKLFDAIVQCCSRWETLEIDSSQPLSQISLSRLRGHLPSLREMTVRFSSSDGQLGTNFFEFAPQLRVARIIDPETVSDEQRRRGPEFGMQMTVILPWAQLTTFESTYTDLRQFEELRSATNLVECQVELFIRDPMWQPPAQPTSFTRLQKLTLDTQPAVLDTILLPSLRELFIRTYSHHLDFQHLVTLLERSGCSLRKFWMHAHPPPDQFLQVLMLNPAIVEIGILGNDHLRHLNGPSQNIDDIIAALTLPSPGGPPQSVYAPALARFSIRDQFDDLNLDAVFNMVDSRRQLAVQNGCVPLQAFSLLSAGIRVHQSNSRARIAAFRAAGIQVEIKREEISARKMLRAYI